MIWLVIGSEPHHNLLYASVATRTSFINLVRVSIQIANPNTSPSAKILSLSIEDVSRNVKSNRKLQEKATKEKGVQLVNHLTLLPHLSVLCLDDEPVAAGEEGGA